MIQKFNKEVPFGQPKVGEIRIHWKSKPRCRAWYPLECEQEPDGTEGSDPPPSQERKVAELRSLLPGGR